MTSEQPIDRSVIVAPNGRPARQRNDMCPRCGAGLADQKRTASSGFGVAHPVCSCGYEFIDEVWRG